MNASTMRAAAACALLATTCLVSPALAQTAKDFRQLDENGVDLVHGDFILSFTEGSIGSGPGELALVRRNGGNAASQWDDYTFRRTISDSSVAIEVGMPGGMRERFTGSIVSTSFTPARANGASLVKTGWSYVHTAADGTRIVFIDPTGSGETESSPNSFCSQNTQALCVLVPETVTSPNGRMLSFWWQLYAMPDGSGGTTYEHRLGSVANSFGYAIAFSYQDDSQSWGSQPSAGWRTRSGAAFRNDAIGTAVQASVGYAYPNGVYAGTADVTDMAGHVWRVTGSSIRRPGESNAAFAVTSSGGIVSSVAKDGVTTSYSRSVSGATGTMTVTNALSQATTIVSNLTIGRPTSITDALNRTTSYAYDGSGRLTRVTHLEGDYVELTLDARGNATQTRAVAKSGSGAATITTLASHASTCTNAATCNSPTSTTDARGNVTDYAYDPAHGGVTSVTAPAPTGGAVRPQTRYAYTLLNGPSTGSGQAMYQLTGMSACQTTASCTGTADEVRTSVVYGANLLPASVSTGAGDGSLTATQAMTYDAVGNLVTVDGPLPGPADTSRTFYNASREVVELSVPIPTGRIRCGTARSASSATRQAIRRRSSAARRSGGATRTSPTWFRSTRRGSATTRDAARSTNPTIPTPGRPTRRSGATMRWGGWSARRCA